MKYYFFRDTDNESNLLDGKTYHAAGYVEKLYCELDKPNPSGKDLAVSFLEPFEGIITSAWRAVNEVELFEVAEWEYTQLVEKLTIPNVSQQSELLQCFCKLANITHDTVDKDIEDTIYRFNAL